MRGTRWWPFEWVVAIRFLQEGKIQTGFIAVGIAIGVAVIVFMSALLAGLQSNFVNRVLTGQAHIQLLNHKETVRPLRDGLAGGASWRRSKCLCNGSRALTNGRVGPRS